MKLLDLPHTNCAGHRFPLMFPDLAEKTAFHQEIDPDEQVRVRELHDAMMQIASATSVYAGAKAVAKKHPRRRGWSWQHLQTIFNDWEKEGRDWRVLVDRKRFPNARKALLHPATADFVVKELLKNQRVYSTMIDAIHRQWRSWWRTGDDQYAIPGFVDEDGRPKCPAPDAGFLPKELLEHNLRRVKIAPAVVEIVRYGTHAARAILPKIPGTRDGLRWLEYVSGDDMRQDVALYVPGYGKCEALQFGFWEYSCSYYPEDCFIQRPRTPKNDGSWEKLKRRDFLFAVALLIERYGWPLDWCMHILCENGTATMSRAQAQWLHEVSDGQIEIGYSSMEGEFVCAWEERRAGNSNAKGGHEGFHGILKSEMGHLRGNQGMDRDHAPALDYGREKLTAKLDNAIVQMRPEDRGQIVTPYLTAPQLFRETRDAIVRIHNREDHECEGFERIILWRPKGLRIEPLPMSELGPWMAANPRVNEENINEHVDWFDRPETRAERQRRLSAEGRFLAPPPGVMVPFYEANIAMARIKPDYSFCFEKDGRKFRFIPQTPDQALDPGDKVVGFYRPDEQVIHLFSSPDGKNRRYIVTYFNEGRLRRNADEETRARFFGRKEAFFNHAYAEVQKATADQVQQARDEAENNALIITASGLLPANVKRGSSELGSEVAEITDEGTRAKTAKAKKAEAEAQASKQRRSEALAVAAAKARELSEQQDD